MKIWIVVLSVGLAGNLLLSWSLFRVDEGDGGQVQAVGESREAGDFDEIRGSLEELRDAVAALEVAPKGGGEWKDDGLEGRVRAIERSLERLESAVDGMGVAPVLEDREALFASDEGSLRAAEYYEAGKFAIAGEGFLTFLEAHPDHPEHRSIAEMARRAFVQAGNLDKAIAIQGELMEIYPENKAGDLMTLADLQKQAGKYQEAAESARESAGLANDNSKYWNLLYGAWYTQLGDGLDAGLAAHQELQKQAITGGFNDDKFNQRIQERIAEIEAQMASR
ncbi:MAG: hypothetical protein ACSHYF_06095 [Verrucomicrobiaceae bacterium]